jgi:hypothetical protein
MGKGTNDGEPMNPKFGFRVFGRWSAKAWKRCQVKLTTKSFSKALLERNYQELWEALSTI